MTDTESMQNQIREVTELMTQIDRLGDAGIGGYETISTAPEYVEHIIDELYKLNILPIKPMSKSMLDKGSGIGNVVRRFAMEGFDAYGIEYDEISHKLAQTPTNIIYPGRATFSLGNYTPDETDDAIISDTLDTLGNRKNMHPKIAEMIKPGWNKPYKQLGVNYNKFDIIHSFPFDLENSITNMFAKYAKVGAILILRPAFNEDYDVPDNLDIIQTSWDPSILGFLKKVQEYHKV